MKEILFNFEEFKSKIEAARYDETQHYAFKRTPSKDGMFTFLEFRIYCWEGPDHLLIFEKTFNCASFEEDRIKEFSDSCKKLASEVSATPGYFEELVA